MLVNVFSLCCKRNLPLDSFTPRFSGPTAANFFKKKLGEGMSNSREGHTYEDRYWNKLDFTPNIQNI